jgi:cohesin domain-containing protein
VRTLLTPPEVHLKAGESGSVSIVALGASGVTAVELALAYDPTALDSVNVSPGSLLTLDGASVGTEINLESGPGRVRAKFTRVAPTTGSGALATVQFRSLKPGSATFAVESLTLTTSAGEERPTPPAPGRIEVTQ